MLKEPSLCHHNFTAKTAEWLENLHDKPKAAKLQAELELIHAIMDGQRHELKDQIDRYQAALAAVAGPPPATPVQQPTDDEPPARSRRQNPKK